MGFPTASMYTKFKQLYKIWDDAAMCCMETVLSEPVKIKKKSNSNNEEETNEKLPDGFEALTRKIDRDNVRKFGGIHSSISLIHYFDQKCAKDEENELKSEEDRLSNRTMEVPLDKHVDTGLLTLITCSDVPGLQILDRKTDTYFYPEE